MTNFIIMSAQETSSKNYKILSKEEGLKYDLGNMKLYKYPLYNESTALFIDDNELFVFPNIMGGTAIIVSKDKYDKMFANNSYPLLPENDTPYFLYKDWMNEQGFVKENMIKILMDIGLPYKEETFYRDAEKLAKVLSEEDKKKLVVPMLYFIGEDLKKLCPEAEWSYNTRRYFHPFNEPILYYEDRSYSFYDLNILLEEKLLKDKNITFQKIYKRVEGYFLKHFNPK